MADGAVAGAGTRRSLRFDEVPEVTTGTDDSRAVTPKKLAAAGLIPASLVDVKGDLIAATGSDAVSRVPMLSSRP